MSESEMKGSQIGSDEKFASLLAQLESCGCGPYDPSIHASGQAERAMDCHSVIENLFEFVDHEMPEEVEQLMLDHSLHCDKCSDAVSAELKMREIIKRSCASTAPEALRSKVSALMSKHA